MSGRFRAFAVLVAMLALPGTARASTTVITTFEASANQNCFIGDGSRFSMQCGTQRELGAHTDVYASLSPNGAFLLHSEAKGSPLDRAGSDAYGTIRAPITIGGGTKRVEVVMELNIDVASTTKSDLPVIDSEASLDTFVQIDPPNNNVTCSGGQGLHETAGGVFVSTSLSRPNPRTGRYVADTIFTCPDGSDLPSGIWNANLFLWVDVISEKGAAWQEEIATLSGRLVQATVTVTS